MVPMEDPLLHVESLDSDVLDYVTKEGKIFREKYGPKSEEIRREVSRLYNTRRVLSVKVSEKGIIQSTLENGKYHVLLGSSEIYSTESVIFWLESDPSGRRIAVFETGGSDRGVLTVIEDGRVVERMEGTISGMSFTENSYYTVRTFTDHEPPGGGEVNSHRVMRQGEVVFGHGFGPEDFMTLYRSGEKIFVVVGDWTRSAVYTGNLEDPSTWKKVKEAKYEITPLGQRNGVPYYLESCGNGVITADDRTVIEPEMPVNSALLVKNGILVMHMKNASVLPVLYDFEGREVARFVQETPMGLKSLDSDGTTAVLAMESFGTPYCILRSHDNDLIVVEEKRVIDASVEERFVDSSGASIHYFLVNSGKGRKSGAVAYGYGGFNIPVVPMYYPLFAYLLEHDVTVAVSNLRGGNEYGEEWHRAGMLMNKQNVFDDFKAVIRSLRNDGLRVVAYGVSNGGLLAGTILTQAPEILNGALIGNPVLDMMRFHRMSVGKYWVSEYGNPDEPEDRSYLLRYSPYHNIRQVSYPDTLIYTRMKDDRVHPAHAIKFHMALRKETPNAYIRANVEGGHIGITAEEMISEVSDLAAFVLGCFNKGDSEN